MDGAHNTGLDRSQIVQSFCHRCQAVGSTGSCRNNSILFLQGKYALADTVSATDDSIIVDGKEIKIYAKANAAELPWGEIGVDVVLECTGFYTSKEKASAHITAGARKVLFLLPQVTTFLPSYTMLTTRP